MKPKLTRKEQLELAAAVGDVAPAAEPEKKSVYEFDGPLWTYAKGYEHWGPERLEDALYEAVYAPGSRSMWRQAQGAPLDVRTMIWDMLEVFKSYKRPRCATCN